MACGIRRARHDDGIVLQAIASEAYTPYIAVMGQVPAPMLADFETHISNDIVFVSEIGGEVCGYAVVLFSESSYWLDNVAVLPGRQGVGMGRALIEAVEAWVAERTDRYQLYTNIMMARNIEMYLYLGFVETGRRVVDGYDRVYFEKRL